MAEILWGRLWGSASEAGRVRRVVAAIAELCRDRTDMDEKKSWVDNGKGDD